MAERELAASREIAVTTFKNNLMHRLSIRAGPRGEFPGPVRERVADHVEEIGKKFNYLLRSLEKKFGEKVHDPDVVGKIADFVVDTHRIAGDFSAIKRWVNEGKSE